MRFRFNLFLIFFAFIAGISARGSDWPMWRYDYARSGNTPEQLDGQLYLQWQISFPEREPVWDDPLNQDLMKYDRLFEPVVADNKLFIGFNDQDKVVAFDLESGKELWSFYADGPVRLPLVFNKGKIYFTGDDGYCYALDAGSGDLVWRRLLAPSGNLLLGNKRLISMWPARGGIVVKDDIIYTAASIFPMMGTFIYALDATTGDIVWKNEGTSSNYILQPHRSPAFAHVAPQGPFTISGEKLLVAGGRSVPAAFNLKTGEDIYYKLSESGKTGGAYTYANEQVFFNHHRKRVTMMYDAETGNRISMAGEYPVIDGNTFYFSGKNIWAAKLNAEKKLDTLWVSDFSATNDMIKAGDCLFAADSTGIKAIKLSSGEKPKIYWEFTSPKNIDRLVAANGKLIAVTNDGTIMVFGQEPVRMVKNIDRNRPEPKFKPGRAEKIIQASGVDEGYAFILGSKNIKLIKGLLGGSSMNLVVFEKDLKRIQSLRNYFDKAGITAGRVSFYHFDGEFSSLPKYFSSLTIVTEPSYIGFGEKEILEQVFETTRPYGGKIILDVKSQEQEQILENFARLNLYGFDLQRDRRISMISREGALPGASPWTHHNGDIANTVKSDDRLVRAPLGVLWFGGNSNMDVLPRHGHGPGEQVIDGRLIIQGINSLSARDVYTGRVIWKREFEKLKEDNWKVFYDETYDEENPLDTKYNQVHLPGANARGTNYIVTEEYVYLIEGNKCNVLDIRDGNIVKVFETGEEETRQLGYIGVYEDLLILGNNFADFEEMMESDSMRIKSPKFTDYNLSASKGLIVMNRFTGEKLWSIKSNLGFIHNSVIAGEGILFCLDKLPQYLETKLRRRGEPMPEGSRLLYLDARTGELIHEETEDIFGTWLGYSSEYKLLLQSTRPSRDMLNGEEGKRMITYNIFTKEKIWDKEISYSNPPILHNDKIYLNGDGYMLLTGEPLTETDPITGEDLKWSFKREYGCGFVAASEYLLTFRSASAGFVNLEVFEGTGSLGGWKPGCSTNLIAADGVLNSPDYTRTCQCAYQNQTSLALINMPWMSYWTNSNYKWNGSQIKKLGLNLNAPGDRSSDDNVLWFEYPYVSGEPPEIPIEIDTVDFRKIRKEPFSVISEKTHWVSSSALEGVRSIEITLAEEVVPESAYTVKLYFAELEDNNPGDRVFDILVNGKKTEEHFDIVKEAGKTNKEVIKSYYQVKTGNTIKIDLIPVKGNTLVSGIEIIQEMLTAK